MKFFAIAALFAVAAVAQPLENHTGGGNKRICPDSLYGNLQCCATDVLGIISLDCKVPDKTPQNGVDFRNICAKTGDQPLCCVIPVAGQSVLCQRAVGTN